MEKREINESAEIDRQIKEIIEKRSEGEKGKKKRKFRLPAGKRAIGSFKSSGKKKKAAIAALLIVAVFWGMSQCGKGKSQAGPVVSVMELKKQPIQEKLTVSGPVSGTDSVDVVSNIHAEITAMNVKEGDKVSKGQVLAVLDKTDLEREVAIAQNAYDEAVIQKEEKDKSEALGYEKAVQDLQKAQADHNRNVQLFAAGGITQAALEESTNALNDARRQVEGYTVVNGRGAADPSYELQIQKAAFELEKKKEELEDTEIKSAIDGTVVRVNSKVGQFADKVEDDKPILSIENLEQLELEIKVSEYSIGKVKVGQKAAISADILGEETEEGEVIKISPTGEEKGGGSTERVIPTTIRIDGESTKLIAGITAKAEILIQESDSAFVIPVTALLDSPDGGDAIAVVENGIVRLIPVTMGIDGDVNVEVIPVNGEELKEGMEVVINGGANIADGMAVIVAAQK